MSLHLSLKLVLNNFNFRMILAVTTLKTAEPLTVDSWTFHLVMRLNSWLLLQLSDRCLSPLMLPTNLSSSTMQVLTKSYDFVLCVKLKIVLNLSRHLF